jgi:ABC-type spermidine/putrescine transport system permease subunit II
MASAAMVSGLENRAASLTAYRDLWTYSQMLEFWLIVKRSVWVSCIAAVLALGVVAAFASAKEFYKRLAIVCILIPLVIPDAVRAFSWAQLLAPDGLIGQLVSAVYGARTGNQSLLALLSVSVVPLTFGAFLAGLAAPKATCWLAAAEMPRHPWVHFSRLVIQAVTPVLLFALAAGFVFSINASAEEQYLGSSTTSMQKLTAGLVNINPSLLGAFGIYLLLFLGLLTALTLILSRAAAWLKPRRWFYVPGGLRQQVRALSNGAARGLPLFAVSASALVLLGLWLPFYNLTILAFGKGSSHGFPTTYFFTVALQSPELLRAFLNSLIVAGTSVFLATWLAVYAARVASSSSGLLLIALIVWPILLPADVQALSIQQVLRISGIQQSGLSSVVMSHTSWLLPFILVATVFAYRRVPPELLQAAREYGYSESQIFRRVVFPVARTSILTTSLALGLLSFTESRRGWHLAGSEPLLSTKVFGSLQSGAVGDGPTVYAMALIALICAVSGCIVVARFARKLSLGRVNN